MELSEYVLQRLGKDNELIPYRAQHRSHADVTSGVLVTRLCESAASRHGDLEVTGHTSCLCHGQICSISIR